MLLDNCGDGNRESPATNHPTPARKESFICNFAERELFFPAGVLGLQTAIVTSWRAFSYAANGYNADDVIEALAKVISAYAIGTRTAAFAAAR